MGSAVRDFSGVEDPNASSQTWFSEPDPQVEADEGEFPFVLDEEVGARGAEEDGSFEPAYDEGRGEVDPEVWAEVVAIGADLDDFDKAAAWNEMDFA